MIQENAMHDDKRDGRTSFIGFMCERLSLQGNEMPVVHQERCCPVPNSIEVEGENRVST
jgi:hypothetical protein